jgi:adenylate cyclase
MFTDMVGYTALGQKNESLSLALAKEQRKLIRPVLARHKGREVKTMGDAFLVEFTSALDAVRCAYDIQRTTKEFNLSMPEERRVHLRVGIHLGDVVESGGDISGDAVNVASRIEPLAEAGGVCLTRQVYDQIQGKFELPTKSLGPRVLKNITSPLEVFKMEMPWGEQETAPSGQLDKKRIAVLPFVNLSQDPNDSYFADGMTEELISTISNLRDLSVISRTSAMRYRGANKSIREIGSELGSGSIIEGSVRKAGNKVRIIAQLIDVEADRHLWSQSYDRDLTDVFAIQGDIAEQVARSLETRLLSGEKQRIRRQATTSPEAYTLYLKGRHYWNERTEEGTKKALRYFDEAVKIDPEFALAYSGIADCYNILSDYGWLPPGEAAPLARANALKALEIDDTLAEAHASLGSVMESNSWDFVGAEREFKRAIEINPSYAPAHQWYSVLLYHLGRFYECHLAGQRALELDPYSRRYQASSVDDLVIEGKTAEAVRRYEELIRMYPDFGSVRLWKSTAHSLAGQFEEAIDEAKKFLEVDNGSWTSKLNLARVYALAGRSTEAGKLLDEAVAARKTAFVSSSDIGWVKLVLGQKEEGYEWLLKAYQERDPNLLEFSAVPWTAEFRSDPRWVDIEKKIGFP